MGPLWVREGIGTLTDPLLHAGRDGGTTRAVERREPTQPGGWRVGGERECVCVCVCVSERASERE